MSITATFLGSNFNDASGTTLAVTGLNTTGYTNLVVFFKHEGAPTALSCADNKGSGAYDGLTKVNHANGDLSSQLFEQKIGTPGTSTDVTVTCAAGRTFRRMFVYGLTASSGDVTLNASAQTSGTGSAVDAGTLSTTAATVSIQGTTPYTFCTYTPGSGWTEGLDSTIHAQHRSDGSSATIDPACTISLSTDWCSNAASYAEATSGPGSGSDTLSVGMTENSTNLVTVRVPEES